MPQRQKSALVTGASSGIGYATSIELAKRGYKVFAGARRLEPMQPLQDTYGIHIFKLDVSSLESVKGAKKYIAEETGGYLDILYNNAGQSCTFPAIDVTDDYFQQCYEVNVFGPMRLVRELSPLIINAKGVIGFTGSVSALVPFPFSCVYSSSKAAIHQYAATLKIEMKPFGVRVVNVVTGGVNTHIEEKRSPPPKSLFNVNGFEEALVERKQMAVRNKPIEPSVYAFQVVNDFENKWSGLNVYRGKMAVLLKFVSLFVPRFLIELYFIRKFKLTSVYQLVKEKYSKKKLE
ncbi:NADPH-dependent 1-acyldihydroxyacetone phosphate reductase [[Candida] railenensis]|uniref:NADPH-dependent 1-acyldihydroxyacetone phosphate reductase n=1 Tax=[Candida] railenensis TaxID=45579 RepID=A0A9P0VY94_9ASCO|nr:NADPH-dependent 1-acyldihydroxyacetone phosphate reductase [[Candida] railenensis]